jgi:hypothetical protein
MLASMVSILVEPAASIFEPLTDPRVEENQACAEHMVKAAVVESSGFAPGTFHRTRSANVMRRTRGFTCGAVAS